MAVNMEGASPPVFEQIFRNARFAQGGNALFEGKGQRVEFALARNHF